MREQQVSSTATSEPDQRGMDRRKFLLMTTAVTAGAWAAPSILTIERAFGDTGSPCAGCARETDAATAKGSVFLGLTSTNVPVRANACLNDDDLGVGPVELPGTLGSIEAGDASCTCGEAVVDAARVNLLLGTTPVTAEALRANSACDCASGSSTGSSQVVNVQVGPVGPISSTTFQSIPLPGGLGFVNLNEGPVESGVPGEYNALHIVFTDPLGDRVELKLASAKVACA